MLEFKLFVNLVQKKINSHLHIKLVNMRIIHKKLIINYDIFLKHATQNALESMGVRFTQFHPDALLAGGGSLRCLTLRLFREYKV